MLNKCLPETIMKENKNIVTANCNICKKTKTKSKSNKFGLALSVFFAFSLFAPYSSTIAAETFLSHMDNNSTTIDIINGHFIGVSNTNANFNVYGGAIYNHTSKISGLNGDMIRNYVESTKNAYGGAIYNKNSKINFINGNITNNHSQAGASGYGGAIYNEDSTITIITGDINDNYIDAGLSGFGGAINNKSNSTIQTIIGDIKDNHIISNNNAEGGAR